jgi:hypothetical protein
VLKRVSSKKYLADLFSRIIWENKTQDFQLKDEYDKAKEILFVLESGESIILSCENGENIQIQIFIP